jgi:hypothetical protein
VASKKAQRAKWAAAKYQYRKTHAGYLSIKYDNLYFRVKLSKELRHRSYKGLYVLKRQDFFKWAKEHPIFLKLYNAYMLSGFQLTKAPTVDRINPSVGYKVSNLEWVTYSENCRRAAVTKKRFK